MPAWTTCGPIAVSGAWKKIGSILHRSLHYLVSGETLGGRRGDETLAGQIERQTTVTGQIRSLFQAGTLGNLTDGQLLERLHGRDERRAEPAFAALAERHGANGLAGMPPGAVPIRTRPRMPSRPRSGPRAACPVCPRTETRSRAGSTAWLTGLLCRSRSAENRRKRHERRSFAERGPGHLGWTIPRGPSSEPMSWRGVEIGCPTATGWRSCSAIWRS